MDLPYKGRIEKKSLYNPSKGSCRKNGWELPPAARGITTPCSINQFPPPFPCRISPGATQGGASLCFSLTFMMLQALNAHPWVWAGQFPQNLDAKCPLRSATGQGWRHLWRATPACHCFESYPKKSGAGTHCFNLINAF